jgi:hypothetical protein
LLRSVQAKRFLARSFEPLTVADRSCGKDVVGGELEHGADTLNRVAESDGTPLGGKLLSQRTKVIRADVIDNPPLAELGNDQSALRLVLAPGSGR